MLCAVQFSIFIALFHQQLRVLYVLFFSDNLGSIKDQALLPFKIPRPSRRPTSKDPPDEQSNSPTYTPYVWNIERPTFAPGKPHYWYGFVWPPTKEPTADIA